MSRLEVLVLGCTGGPFESNLSSYALIDKHKNQAILLDAGTILTGLQLAYDNGNLSDFPSKNSPFMPARYFLHEIVKAILISHVHLDHILGMILASQIDKPKPILGLGIMMDYLRDHIFNGKIWANLANEGENPSSIYHYVRLPLESTQIIEGTNMKVEAYMLNHTASLPSTAFFVYSEDHYVLYFGDTSSDFVESMKRNEVIWQKAASLIREKKLKAIFLECSYPNSAQILFGHLNPQLLNTELHRLQEIANCSLKGLKVIVTHRKQSTRIGEDTRDIVARELTESNTLGCHYYFPRQGERIIL